MEKLFKNLKLFLEKKIFSMLMLDLKLKLGILDIKIVNYYGVNVKIPIFLKSILEIFMEKIGEFQTKNTIGKKIKIKQYYLNDFS